MADAVVSAAVSCVIERLGDLLIDEAKFLSGVKGQIENAKIKLQCMAAFLKDADAFIKRGDERVRLMVVQVRDASYDFEDVIETYIFKVVLKKERGLMGVLKRTVCLSREGIDIHKVGSKMESISSNIDTWISELQKYGVTNSMDRASDTCSSQIQERRELRRAYSYFVENDVVGFDKDIKELVDRLTPKENPRRHRVISICGMGGLGKTTLARKVYHHPQVRSHFDCFAWVAISQQCVVREVWEHILFGLTSPTMEKRDQIKKLSDSEIAKELYNIQKQLKCLVLLDDIWTTSTWDRLKAAFPQDEINSKILLTTRIKNIGSHADQYCYTHELKCLDDDQSWELFQKKSSYFGADQTNIKDAERMETLGREMLNHCSGLPLAITVLSGLLSGKHTVDEWEKMKRNVVKYISKGKKHGDSEGQGVSWVLGLSYDELPFYLKPCFLYLAGYPEDAAIQVKELCLMLMAEGFIAPTNDSTETMEDIAYDYLCELVERSMIQVESWGLRGRMKTFRIHDLMRDLCVSKAQDDKFFHFVDLRNKVEEPQKLVSMRAAIESNYGYDVHVFFSGFDHKNGSLRCLIINNDIYSDLGWNKGYTKLLTDVSKKFLRLRILKLTVARSLNLPKNIGDLIHLRMLIINASVTYVPSSIGNLRWLQTLKIGRTYQRVPDVLWKLEKLRHLYLDIFCNPWYRRMKLPNTGSLLTLVGVSPDWFDFGNFTPLKNLKKLKIVVLPESFYLFRPPTFTLDCLENLQVFRYTYREDIDIVPIISMCPHIYKLKLIAGITKLPEYNQFSPNLIKLELQCTELMDDPMSTLERLSSLKVLKLNYKSFLGNAMVCSKEGFPRLESLKVSSLGALEEWKVEEGALSSLRFLGIDHCRELRRVPDGLRYITTLKEMKIEDMPSEFIERIKKGGEDFYKVEHVPSCVLLAEDV